MSALAASRRNAPTDVCFPAGQLHSRRARPLTVLRASGSAAPSRSTASAAAVGRPDASVSTSGGSSASGARLALTARHEDADRRLVRPRMHRQHRDRAEGRRQRREHVGQPVRAPDQRQRAARTQQPRRGLDPGGEQRRAAPHAPARRAASGDVRCRAGSLNGGFISTRVTLSAARPAAAKARAGAATSSATARTRVARPLSRAFSRGQRRELRIDLDQRHRRARDARGQRQAGGADAGAEIDDRVAGARRDRPPPAGWRRGRRDGRAAAAAAAAGRRAPRPR